MRLRGGVEEGRGQGVGSERFERPERNLGGLVPSCFCCFTHIDIIPFGV